MDHVLPPGHPHAHLPAAVEAKEDGGKDNGSAEVNKVEVAAVDGSSEEGTTAAMEQDEEGKEEESVEAKRKREEEEEEAKKKEEEEEPIRLVKVGARTLIPVVGEDVAGKVRPGDFLSTALPTTLLRFSVLIKQYTEARHFRSSVGSALLHSVGRMEDGWNRSGFGQHENMTIVVALRFRTAFPHGMSSDALGIVALARCLARETCSMACSIPYTSLLYGTSYNALVRGRPPTSLICGP